MFGGWTLPQLGSLLHTLSLVVAADRDAEIHRRGVTSLPPWLGIASLSRTWADVIAFFSMAAVEGVSASTQMAWARALVLVTLWLSDVARCFCFAAHGALAVRAPSRLALGCFMPLLQRHVPLFLDAPAAYSDEAPVALVHAVTVGLLTHKVEATHTVQ